MDVFHESRFFRQYQALANVLTLPLGKPSKLLPQEVVMIIRHGRAVSQGKQGLFWGGASGGLPSPPPAGALSPAGSGDAAQWAASITDRRGSGDQALNGAQLGTSAPQRGRQDLAFCKPLAGCPLRPR